MMATRSYEEVPASSSTDRRGRSSTEERMSDNTHNASSTEVGLSDNSESIHSPTKGSRCSSGRINSVNHAFETEPFKRGSGHFELRSCQEYPLRKDEPEAFAKESVKPSTSPPSNRQVQTPLQAQTPSQTCSCPPAEDTSTPRAAPDQKRAAKPRLLDMVTDLSSAENDYRVLPLLIGCIIPVSPLNLFEPGLSSR